VFFFLGLPSPEAISWQATTPELPKRKKEESFLSCIRDLARLMWSAKRQNEIWKRTRLL